MASPSDRCSNRDHRHETTPAVSCENKGTPMGASRGSQARGRRALSMCKQRLCKVPVPRGSPSQGRAR
eukprot:6830565-Pyramimonas_sp.AAC.1